MSLIADSLKKIEKGENDTPSKEQGFLAPPLMQKDFGGSKKGGGKGSSKLLLIIVLVVIVGVGGAGAFLYVSGMLDNLLFPEPAPVVRPVRNIPPVETVQEEVVAVVPAENVAGGNVVKENVIDFIQTESAQDMNMALAENMTVANIPPLAVDNVTPKTNNTPQTGIVLKDDVVVAEKPKNVTKKQTPKKNATKEVKQNTPKVNKAKTPVKNADKGYKKTTNTAVTPPKTKTPKAAVKETKVANVQPKAVVPVARKPVEINDKLAYTALIAQGEKAVDRRDFESAIDIFKKAGEIDNSNVLMGNIASLYVKIAKPAIASEIVIVNKITDPAIVSSLIIDMADNKYLVQALVLLKYAANSMPVSSQIIYAEGFYYEIQRGYVKASEYYLKAFEMNPREPAYLYSYARCLDFSEQYYKALENYVKVVAMKPDNKLKVIAEQRIRSLQGYLRNDK